MLIAVGCTGPVDPGSAPDGQSPDDADTSDPADDGSSEPDPADDPSPDPSPSLELDAVTLVAWADTDGDGLWQGSTALSEGSTAWSGSVDLQATGNTLLYAYGFDASGALAAVGRKSENVSANPANVAFGLSSMQDVTLVGGSVQGRPLELTPHANAIAGSGTDSGHADGTFQDGTRLNTPYDITTDGTHLYVTDAFNHVIRKMSIQSGELTTLAGSSEVAGTADSSDGTGDTARFNRPYGITLSGDYLYVTDKLGDNTLPLDRTIRRVHRETGETTTVVAGLAIPRGIVALGGDLYFVDGDATVRHVDLDALAVTIVAGEADTPGTADGTGADARFHSPTGITTDGTVLYVADRDNENVRTVDPATGQVTTLAGLAGESGFQDGTGADARFSGPAGLTSDGTYLYLTETRNHTVRRIEIATGAVTTVAGSAGTAGSTWGEGDTARFWQPEGITTDGINLYLVSGLNHLIRKIQ